MSERASFRGASTSSTRGSSHPRSGGRTRGSSGHGHGHTASSTSAAPNANAGGAGAQNDKPKKENILDLGKYLNREIRVKFNGGREVTGVLKGHDQLMNLVLDDVVEIMQDDEGTQSSRALGLIVARGTLLVMISPKDGSEEIENPFLNLGSE